MINLVQQASQLTTLRSEPWQTWGKNLDAEMQIPTCVSVPLYKHFYCRYLSSFSLLRLVHSRRDLAFLLRSLKSTRLINIYTMFLRHYLPDRTREPFPSADEPQPECPDCNDTDGDWSIVERVGGYWVGL